ncbi:hypothetical protein BBK14_05270 [Parafrankia soli]|uniref:Uncharacterized protein n=1 Tax=Parafrankia soli TaxID=2599596 RepID=A0A1S1Q259_9ACTN|nr:hypothetical protein BBK14_05270 [Parafrankia soli]
MTFRRHRDGQPSGLLARIFDRPVRGVCPVVEPGVPPSEHRPPTARSWRSGMLDRVRLVLDCPLPADEAGGARQVFGSA